ncbi:glutathione S-transferase family protein [Ostreibacterium oceani]|uniref:Glutathione S-transferase C-terminal domain-containing protein n=1 Tax=Ostreibacterium oceani TaxID=2654998 RepID=A0A6N7EXH9_9GAMM|nr:glutathione S-transferase family protein [Ostreibacterium oceani]MPV86250.1 hypothetical protein [Ostreibacterium oceani]
MTNTDQSAYTLYYWTACQQFWGRAIGVVLTLDEAGADYTIREPKDAPTGEGEALFAHFRYPAITLPNGMTIGQTPAILQILGQTFGLAGQTEAEQFDCQQTVLDINDIFSDALSGKLADKPERATQWFELLSHKLKDHRFLINDAPTVGDFHAVFATEWVHRKYRTDAYNDFPALARWWQDICAHPSVHKMKNSGIAMLP